MKAEFELTLDYNGRSIITFKHFDKDQSLEQKVLGKFIKACMNNGIEIFETGSFADLSNLQTQHKSYIIAPKINP